MSRNIQFQDIGDAIVEIVGDYTQNVRVGLAETTKEHGKQLLQEAKKQAPVRTGTYKKHLAVRNDKMMLGDIKSTIYVKKPHYRLAHLLEKGHALPQGGRARAYPHFKPALDFVEPKYVREIKRVIERGGI